MKIIIKVQHINFWKVNKDNNWFINFFKKQLPEYNFVGVENSKKCDILIASVFGNLNTVKNVDARIKIFFTGENLKRYSKYNINLLKNNFDIILGFNYTNKINKILRFPLWLMYYQFFDVEENNNIVDYIINERNKNKKNPKNIFGSCISRHNQGNIRGRICDSVSKYGKIMYPSKFRKNCNLVNNNKKNFLLNVKYNICPENSAGEGYFTEKIFQAFDAGCVPIYWAGTYPEIDIINKNSYIFVNHNNNNLMNKQISEGINNYDKLINEEIFTKDAKEKIKIFYDDFKNELKENIINKIL